MTQVFHLFAAAFSGPVTFVMTAIDGGLLPDTFTLALSDGYAITGTVPISSIVIQ